MGRWSLVGSFCFSTRKRLFSRAFGETDARRPTTYRQTTSSRSLWLSYGCLGETWCATDSRRKTYSSGAVRIRCNRDGLPPWWPDGCTGLRILRGCRNKSEKINYAGKNATTGPKCTLHANRVKIYYIFCFVLYADLGACIDSDR